MAPGQGHLIALERVFGYLRYKHKDQIVISTGMASIRKQVNNHAVQNWSKFYLNASEDIPMDRPKPRGKQCQITCYVDADLARV